MRRPSNAAILVAAFCVALAGTFLLAFRTGREARHLRWENEPIRPWMTVPFVAHTHHMPSTLLFHAIGVEPQPHDRRPLREIAREQHRPVEEMIREMELALAGAGHRHPAGEPPGSPVP